MGRVADPVASQGRIRRVWRGVPVWAWCVLAAIVVLGAAMRFWNLNWDMGHYNFHPD